MSTVIKPKRSEVAASVPSSGDLQVGEIAINLIDGKLYSKRTDATVVEIGGAGSTNLQSVTNSGNTTTNDIQFNSGKGIIFEGFQANAFETYFIASEPTSDRTITLPDITGTVITTGNLTDITSLGTISSDINLGAGTNIVFEGATDNDYETTLTVQDPTQDQTITLPNQTGVLATEGDALAYAIVFGS